VAVALKHPRQTNNDGYLSFLGHPLGLSGVLQRLLKLVLEGDKKQLKAEGESEGA